MTLKEILERAPFAAGLFLFRRQPHWLTVGFSLYSLILPGALILGGKKQPGIFFVSVLGSSGVQFVKCGLGGNSLRPANEGLR